MNYKEFIKDIKGDSKNVYLLYGNEKYLIDWAISTIKDKFVDKAFEDMNFTSIDIKNYNSDSIIAIAETLPMMADKRVILIDYPVMEGTKIKNFTEEDEKAIVNYMDKVSQECIMVFVCGEKVDKRKSLYKKLSKLGAIYEFSQLSAVDLKKWIEKQFKQAKKVIKPENIMLIIEISGYYDKESDYALYNLDNDIKKIISYVGDTENEISKEAIYDTMSSNMERNVFALMDNTMENKKEKALELLSNSLLYGEAEYKLLALLHKQYENMLFIKLMKENGKDMEYMKNSIKLPDFVVRKYSANSSKMTSKDLKSAIIDLYNIDKNIKSGIISPELALEMFIACV